ncbi:hypothetical protein AWENTII_011022 [Aspergillus wentii]
MAKRALQSVCAISPLGRKNRTVFSGSAANLPAETPIEEERVPGYRARHYFPVEPGYIFNQRYEALAKLGWGTSSTVWLVRDLHR